MAFKLINSKTIEELDDKARNKMVNVVKNYDPKKFILYFFNLLQEIQDKEISTKYFREKYSIKDNVIYQSIIAYSYLEGEDIVKVIDNYYKGNEKSIQNFKKNAMKSFNDDDEFSDNFISVLTIDDSIIKYCNQLKKNDNIYGEGSLGSPETYYENGFSGLVGTYKYVYNKIIDFANENDADINNIEDLESLLLFNGFEKEVDYMNIVGSKLVDYYNNLINKI